MCDLIVSVPDHCLSFYFGWSISLHELQFSCPVVLEKIDDCSKINSCQVHKQEATILVPYADLYL